MAQRKFLFAQVLEIFVRLRDIFNELSDDGSENVFKEECDDNFFSLPTTSKRLHVIC